MTTRFVEIELDGPGHGHVRVNGVEVDGVRAVRVISRIGKPNAVLLEIEARKVTVSGPFENVDKVKKVSPPCPQPTS